VTIVASATRASAGAEGSSPLNFLQAIDLAPALLAGNGTFTSEEIDLSGMPGFARWRVLVFSDQAGTCTLQQSPDGVTFYPTQVNAYAAGGQAALYESLVSLRYLQVSYVNGAALQAQFRLLATLVAV
jgi:hypothetical protein